MERVGGCWRQRQVGGGSLVVPSSKKNGDTFLKGEEKKITPMPKPMPPTKEPPVPCGGDEAQGHVAACGGPARSGEGAPGKRRGPGPGVPPHPRRCPPMPPPLVSQ